MRRGPKRKIHELDQGSDVHASEDLRLGSLGQIPLPKLPNIILTSRFLLQARYRILPQRKPPEHRQGICHQTSPNFVSHCCQDEGPMTPVVRGPDGLLATIMSSSALLEGTGQCQRGTMPGQCVLESCLRWVSDIIPTAMGIAESRSGRFL